ncbi:MAG: hypothetical protein ACE5KV_02965 [Thermoplasmata archaeon]
MKLGKGKSLSREEGSQEGCDYSVQSIGDKLRLSVKCKDCEGKANLLESRCRNRVIEILLEEPPLDSIVLSGFVETLYEDKAVLLIQGMADLLRKVKHFAKREIGGRSDRCARCKRSPSFVFRRVENAFRSGLPALYREIKLQSSGFSSKHNSCRECTDSTNSDLQSLLAGLERLKSFILMHAFRISNRAVRR